MKTDNKATRHYSRFSSGRSRSRSSRRRGWKRYLLPVLAAFSVIGVGLLYTWMSESEPAVVMSAAPADGIQKPFERTAALPPLNLPADDAPHGSGMEWWYYNGILDAKTGQRYAFHVAIFVANGLVKHTVMHVALTDFQTGKRYASQSRTGGIPAKNTPNGFDFRQDGWQATASGNSHVLRASLEGASMALNLTDSHPAVAHRAPESETPGLLDFGPSGISYYYSRPRISTQGEIVIDGKPVQVSGEVWFDHQWGEFDVLSLGWNWFALHFADGSDAMVYELFDMSGRKVMTAGTLSNARGSVPLKQGEVELTPVNTWTSPKTDVTYTVEWKLRLPSGAVNIKPFFADSEFDSRQTTSNIYWEGPVKVEGGAGGQGFLELSGYDRLKTAQSGRR